MFFKNEGKIKELNRRTFLRGSTSVAGAFLIPVNYFQQLGMKSQSEITFSKKLPVNNSFDVVVCGGGPAGISAALSARRSGLNVLLIEGQAQLGGMGTSGLVSHWLGGRTDDGQQWVVGGLFRSIVEEAAELKIAQIPKLISGKKYQPHGWYKGQLSVGIPFDPFLMASYLDKKILESGVKLLLQTQAVDVIKKNNKITHIIIYNKSGLSAIRCETVIDATGDADIAFRSGCEIAKGRKEDGLMTPTTLQFHVYNVDQDKLSDYIFQHDSPRFREKIKELKDSNEWIFPYDIFISVQLNEKGTMMINTSRLTGVDGTAGQSVTDGLIRGREETFRLLKIMRKHFPGFKNAKIKAVASTLGIRETRRIISDYILSVDDLIRGKEFEDTIGFSAYGWDLPDPQKPSYQPMHEKKVKKRRPVTPIPYKIMLPNPIENLICPGRVVSVERDVLGPLRVTAPCFAMGEAAGLAASLAVGKDNNFGKIETKTLRENLINNNVIVNWSS